MSTLAGLVRAKRQEEGLSVRGAAEAAGVSFSTISRVESEHQPDLANFLNICAWLGVDASRFAGSGPTRREAALENAIRHLSADPRLSAEASQKITRMVRDMYEALAAPEITSVVAAHLRAATVLRPGVPERLASLVRDMHRQLERHVAKDGA